MYNIKILKNFKKPTTIIQLAIVFIACTILIFINIFTIRVLSGSRAYINGESHYSKGQKDAILNLFTYLYLEDEKYWELYKIELSVPQGDGAARIALTNNLNDSIVKKGFRAGRNDEDDLNDMIWVFKNFKSIPFFHKAIIQWEKGDLMINEISKIGNEIHKRIKNKTIDAESKHKFFAELNEIGIKLSVNEMNFSQTLGKGTREIKDYLIYANIFFILIIFGSVSFYYSTMIQKLLLSKKELDESNQNLHLNNQDLEKIKMNLSKEIMQQKKIIGTISHDISSPLKYIVLIGNYLCMETEKNKESNSYKYASTIYKSSSQLYEFTKVLVEYSKIYIEDKDRELTYYSLFHLAQNKIEIFKEIANNNNAIIINTVDKKLFSHVNYRIISIIMHNLLDNAVKNTTNGKIEIGSYADENKVSFWIEDMGKGMDHKLIEYYMNRFKNKESEKLILNNFGIGLHFVLELLIIIKGNITFSSIIDKGTKVTIDINY